MLQSGTRSEISHTAADSMMGSELMKIQTIGKQSLGVAVCSIMTLASVSGTFSIHASELVSCTHQFS